MNTAAVDSGYLLYCRFLILLVFAFSFVAKAAAFSSFRSALVRLGLPHPLSRVGAPLVLALEFGVVVAMLLPNRWITLGFALAVTVLIAFTAVLVKALREGRETTCNCFGPADRPISNADVVRNYFLAACAVVAVALSQSGQGVTTAPPDPLAIVALGGAVLSALVIINLKELAGVLD